MSIDLLTQRESDVHDKLRILVHYGAQFGLKVKGSSMNQ